MDGENHGKPYYSMDDLGEKTLFLETSTWSLTWLKGLPRYTLLNISGGITVDQIIYK